MGKSKHVKTLKYQLKLTGLDSASGTIPVRALREVCDLLLEAAERVACVSQSKAIVSNQAGCPHG